MGWCKGAAALAGSAVMAVGLAQAQPAQAPDRQADWVRRPTAEDLFAVWPAEAIRRGVGGVAVLECTITAQGAPTDCRVVSETPAGAGFGAAALSMSPQFGFRPARRGGVAVASTVRLPITFQEPTRPLGSHLQGEMPLMRQRMVQRPNWLEAPSFADLIAVYPARARTRRIAGAASFSCVIGGDGRLNNCELIGEEPRDQGFATAARALTRRFRAPVEAQPGEESLRGAHTQVRIAFPVEALDAARPAIGRPNWAQRPSGAIPGSGYPRAAANARVLEGLVMLDCVVGADGHLQNCTVAEETPGGYGFGQAALALSSGFVMTLWGDDGLPTVGAGVRVPVRYRLPSAPAGAAPPTAPSP